MISFSSHRYVKILLFWQYLFICLFLIFSPCFVILLELMDLSENENMITNENELNDNEIIIEEDMERSKENASFPKEINKLEKNEKIMQTILENFPDTHPKKLMTKTNISCDPLDIHKSNLVVVKIQSVIFDKTYSFFFFFFLFFFPIKLSNKYFLKILSLERKTI